MRLTLALFVIAFIALPPDAQLWLVGIARVIWLTEPGQAFLAGALGASFAAMVWYSLGWDAHVNLKRREAIERAESDANRERRFK